MKIRIYISAGCPWCRKVRDYLKDKNLEFEEKDVTFDVLSQDEMMKLTGYPSMSVPVIHFCDTGDVVVGWNKDAIDRIIQMND